MATYTVRPGDTLGAIASRYGTSISKITGYRSGNPNLIYPGEKLTVGGGGGAKKAAPTTSSYQSQAKSLIAAAQKAADARTKALMNQQATETARREAAAKAQEEAFLGKYTTAIGGQEALDAMRARLSQELGLPGAQEAFRGLNEAITGLTGTIANLPEDVEARTRGTLTTAAQQAGITAAQGDPLQRRLADLARSGQQVGQNVAEMQGELGQQLQLGVAQQQKELQPLEMEAEFLSDRISREMTGYNVDKQNQLNVLLNQLQSGMALTQSQVSLLADLALQEDQFQKQKEMLMFQQQFKTGAAAGTGGVSITGGGGGGGTPTSPKPKVKPSDLGLGANFAAGTPASYGNINLGNLGFTGGFSLGSGLGTGR